MTPFTFEEIQIKDSTIYFCSFIKFEPNKHFEHLSEEEISKVEGFRSDSRKMEYVATRVLKHSVFGEKRIEYSEIGAPYIKETGFISISHTHNMVAIGVNPNYKIGLDLETPRDNVLEVASKFLSEEEKTIFNILNKLEVTKIWSAKEALYKLAGRKKIHFKTELLLKKHSGDVWQGLIINPNHSISAKLNIFEHRGIIVSINNEQVCIQK
ncbi:MAG: 4'-phosphopantetheinyl transferase superfamily protein [Fluviicola sp.]|nr:4'-phosphopantetheinyl transferase superfamily protein [Fluviicola sp.]